MEYAMSEEKPDKNPPKDPKADKKEELQGTAITTTGPDGKQFHRETGYVTKDVKKTVEK
jgi:hypothetical protein